MSVHLETRCETALARVTFPVASWDKRFFRNIPREPSDLTVKQRYWLVKLTYKYRRQIGDKVLIQECAEWLVANKPEEQLKAEL